MNSQESVSEFTDNDIVKILASKLEVVMELLCSKEDIESFDALNEMISDAFMAFFNALITEIGFLPSPPVSCFPTAWHSFFVQRFISKSMFFQISHPAKTWK